MKTTTKIKESLNGHTVEFTIGVQTFSLAEIEAREYEGSLKMAQWYEKQLKHALSVLVTSALQEAAEKIDKKYKEHDIDVRISEYVNGICTGMDYAENIVRSLIPKEK